MAFVDWRARFSVSSPEMDAHHQHLFEVVNQLHGAILARRGQEELETCIAALFEYARLHFAAEERLMEACAYPGYPAHKEEHERLLNRVAEMDRAFHQPGSERRRAVPEALAFLLKEWLMTHILVMDKDYGPYVARGGGAAGQAHGACGGQDPSRSIALG